MKRLLTILFIFQSTLAFSQAEGIDVHSIKDFKTYGYIVGIKLDSIEADYARFGWFRKSLYFDYGQGVRRKEMLITDKKGLLLIVPGERVFLLNFFYFNGWEYVPDSTIDLLKKRK